MSLQTDVTGDNIADANATGDDIADEDDTDGIAETDVAGRGFTDGEATHNGVTFGHDKWLRRAAAVMMEQIRLMINETDETTRTTGRKTRVARRQSSACFFTPPNKVLTRWRAA